VSSVAIIVDYTHLADNVAIAYPSAKVIFIVYI